MAGNQSEHAQPFGWAVRTPDLAVTLRHLGLRATAGSRARPDGRVLRWRTAGIEEAIREPSLPFFMEWEEGAELPGRELPRDGGESVTVVELHLRGDPARIADWLGPHGLPVTIRQGAPAVLKVVLAGPDGEIVLRGR